MFIYKYSRVIRGRRQACNELFGNTKTLRVVVAWNVPMYLKMIAEYNGAFIDSDSRKVLDAPRLTTNMKLDVKKSHTALDRRLFYSSCLRT